MASEKPISSVLESISTSHCECGICANRYKDPKILDCLHSFCLQCLNDYITKTYPRSRSVPCPLCRSETTIPETGAGGLKTNFFMVSLMEEVARQQKKFIRFYSEPKKMPPEDLKCPKHKGEAMRFFCTTCEVLICRDCTVVAHSRPEHVYIEAHQAAMKYKESLTELLFPLEDKLEEIEKRGLMKTYFRMVSPKEDFAGHQEKWTRSDSKTEKTMTQEVPKCPRHEVGALRFFCLTCEILICRDCTVVDHPKPEHVYIEAHQAAMKYRKSMTELLFPLEDKLEEIEKRDLMKTYFRMVSPKEDFAGHQKKWTRSDSETEKTMTQEDPKCPRHEVGALRFFCLTCEILICRDCTVVDHPKPEHVYIEADQAAMKYRKSMTELLSPLEGKLKDIKQRLATISQTKHELSASKHRITAEVKKKAEELKQEIMKQAMSIIEGTERVEITRDLTNVAPDSNFLSLYLMINKDVKLLRDQNTPEVDSCRIGLRFKQGQGVDDINLGELEIVAPRRWELCREFGKKGSGSGEFNIARDIAARHHDEIAVADVLNNRVQILGVDGTYKCQIPLKERPWAVALAKQSNRLIVVCKTQVKVFNQDNSLAFQISTVPPDEAGKTSVFLSRAAIKKDGNILVGDVHRKVVTEHSPTDGALLRTIPVGIEPTFIAVGSNNKLIISSWHGSVVHVTDGDGTTLFSIRPTIGGQPVDHCAGVWSDRSGLYIAVSNEGAGTDGHIHHYDAQGAFLTCIARGLYHPQGITMTPAGQIAVADWYTVKIYHYSNENKDRKASKIQDDSVVVKPDKSMTEALYTAQDDASPLPTIRGTNSCPKTHLQLLLDEFNNQTADMSESDRWETCLQLPYIALGYFDHKGGNLDLKEYGVHLTIPQGALPQGHDPQIVYIYVDPAAPPLDKMTPPEVPLAPVVQCGHQGLQFEKNVILSFPHIPTSGKDDQINPRMCHDDPTEAEWEEFDGKAMFVTDDRVIFLVDHFTKFTVSNSLSDGTAKLLTLAPFGPVLDPTSGRYRFRVHGWNHDDKATETNVKGLEEEMSSEMLDVFRSLVFSLHQGDLVIEVTDLIEGWTSGSSRENIANEKIRHIPSNSVTFDLTQQQQAAASSASDPDISWNVLSYQKSADEHTRSWNNVRFTIRPQLNGHRGRPRCENQPSRCTCDKEQFCLGLFRKHHGKTRPEKFGGLLETVVMELCNHLDEDDADKHPRWKRFADNLGVWGKLTENCRTYAFLEIYFEVRRASGKDNEQSVKFLVADLREVHYYRAVQIIEEGMVNRVPEVAQKAEPVPGLVLNGTERQQCVS